MHDAREMLVSPSGERVSLEHTRERVLDEVRLISYMR